MSTNNYELRRVQDLSDRPDLSSWEMDFLDSLDTRLRAGKSLTETQIDKLDEIWEKYK